LVAAGVLFALTVVAASSRAVARAVNQIDSAVLRQFAGLRSAWLTDVADVIDRVASGWTVTLIGLTLLVALMVLKRWRHLFTLLGATFVIEIIADVLYRWTTRPRPYDVTIIGRWDGWSFYAAPLAVVALLGVAVSYTLVVAGRGRQIAKALTAVVVLVVASSQLYLATFHPSDMLVGVTITVALLVNAFRFFTPNEVFPIAYGGGKTAHLDVGGRRGDAIRHAIQDQLGLTVVEVEPFGLAGSGGSTPLRIRIQGDPDTYLFGKLYAMSHVRADRWYKLGRTLLYGRLEDETPFQSVARLAEYEDYMLRVMRDAGVPTAEPYGIVELTPAREYLIVTEFFDHATEIGDAEVTDEIIDDGLELVRKLWDSGLAHRDIKPANLLVRDGRLALIDVAFAQVRPSPWRQAVDLANMMLVLAVRTDADRVYEHALRYFTPDEIGEAFAAARGVASPTQLRTVMKQDGRDLLARFRSLAPAQPTISLQRWSPLRVGLAVVVIVVLFLFVQASAGLFTPAHDLGVDGTPTCGTGSLMILSAQSVPSARHVPCIASLPAGWGVGGVQIDDERARFWLDSDVAGDRAVEVTLLPPDQCSVRGATQVPSDEVGTRRYERVARLRPSLRSTRTYVFAGGCVTYAFAFDVALPGALFADADSAIAFVPRRTLVAEVRRADDLSLCGAGARCTGGS
jgi:tRNA A-37 threonylcarbamoyl transferase component Bud32